MAKEIILENKFGPIIVDDDDYEWISSKRWRGRHCACKERKKIRIFIQSIEPRGKKRIFLHKIFFPFSGKKGNISFKDGNEFNYQKNNIRFEKYYTSKIFKSDRFFLRVNGVNYSFSDPSRVLGIAENKTVIYEKKGRQLPCVICALNCYETRYKNCLDVAAQYNWRGWKMLSGEWCQELYKIVKDRQRAEKFI